jgi:hypothetical protein
MLSKQELVWLNALQSDLALRKDWVAVGHVQALIDRIAGEHGLVADVHRSNRPGQSLQ